MLSAERKSYILACLARDGRVLSPALCDALQVSEDTIRRDLRELAAEGLLRRVHGGALPLTRLNGLSSGERLQVRSDEKRALAAAMAARLRPGQVVILDGGSTHLLLAQSLPETLRLTVVTHSPAIADALSRLDGVQTVVIGGRLSRRAGVTLGAAVVDAFRGLRADVCVVGVCGVDAGFGISCEDYEEVAVKQAMLAASTDSYVLASSDKFGACRPFAVAPLGALGHVLTTAATSAEDLNACREAGAALEIV